MHNFIEDGNDCPVKRAVYKLFFIFGEDLERWLFLVENLPLLIWWIFLPEYVGMYLEHMEIAKFSLLFWTWMIRCLKFKPLSWLLGVNLIKLQMSIALIFCGWYFVIITSETHPLIKSKLILHRNIRIHLPYP